MKIVWGTVVENGCKVRRHIILEDKNCEFCGNKFTPQKTISRYCSRDCGKQAERNRNANKNALRTKEWYRNNKGIAKERRREYYLANRERLIEYSKDYRNNHLGIKKVNDGLYKDKIRHGSLKELLIEKHGMICQWCGKQSDSFDLTAHHVSGDPTDHKNQTLLCRSCHAKVHDLGSYGSKDISKEQIEDALTKFKRLEDACKYLGITRSFLRKKRIEYGFPKRKVANGLGVRKRKKK